MLAEEKSLIRVFVFVCVFSFFVGQGTATFFSDDFEDDPDGSVPAGWDRSNDGSSGEVAANTSRSSSGAVSVRSNQSNTGSPSHWEFWNDNFSPPSSYNLTFDYYLVTKTNTGSADHFEIRNTASGNDNTGRTSFRLNFADDGDKITARDGSTNRRLTSTITGRWVDVSVRVNFTADEYNVKLDGTQHGPYDFPESGKPSDFNVLYHFNDNHLGYIDNFKAVPLSFAGGAGTPSNPYKISTCQELQNMETNLSANYKLVSDINCDGFSFSSVGDYSNNFTGVLDGQKYKVQNLEIEEGSSNYVGLIGFLGGDGEVRNIGVVDAEITGDTSVGPLVGYTQGSISNSYSTGDVSGNVSVGGLIGDNSGTVSNSYSETSVSSSGSFVGGLIGDNSGTVSNSYSETSVSGSAEWKGGLIGTNDVNGDVNDSYSTGDVSGSGGFVGGLVGGNGGSSSVSTSYWDKQSSDQSSGVGDNYGSSDLVGLTTSEMQGGSPFCQNTMSDLDFSNTWFAQSSDYPGLRVFESSPSNLDCNFQPSFRRTVIEVPERYRTISTTKGTKKSLTFTVENPSARNKNLDVSLHGANTSFQNGQPSKTVSIGPGSSKTFKAVVETLKAGNRELVINASNTNTLLNNKRTIPVNSEQPVATDPDNPTQTPTTREVPGMTTVYMLALTAGVLFFFWSS